MPADNESGVTLRREPWSLPAELPLGEQTIVPLRAGETLRWRFQS